MNSSYYHLLALAKFLKQEPLLQNAIFSINQQNLQEGESLYSLRLGYLEDAFEAAAAHQGIGSWELELKVLSDSPRDLEKKLLDSHKEIAKMVCMPWDDYCKLQGLVK
ncbi:DNA repair protein [Pseudomonas sp. L13]|nr:DNA repair protein [Pseudomonas sp. L13]